MAKATNKLILIFFIFGTLLYLMLMPSIRYPVTTLLKPLPILFLILISLKSNTNKPTKTLLILALSFSLLGDIALTLPLRSTLEAGILLFMLAHCSYIALYLRDALWQPKRLIYFLPVLAFIVTGFHYLSPHLGAMTLAVTIYLSFLTLMVLCAFQVKQQPLLIGSGACLFLLSDFVLALNLFLWPDNEGSAIVIMLLYYLAQLLLVAGISQPRFLSSLNP